MGHLMAAAAVAGLQGGHNKKAELNMETCNNMLYLKS